MRHFFRAITNVVILIILPRWGKKFEKTSFLKNIFYRNQVLFWGFKFLMRGKSWILVGCKTGILNCGDKCVILELRGIFRPISLFWGYRDEF